MKLMIAFVLLAGMTFSLSARTWTNANGRSVEGEFIRMDGTDHVVVKIREKEHRLALADLSAADRQWLAEREEEMPVDQRKNTSPEKVSLLGVPLKTGRNVVPMDTSSYPFEQKNKAHSAKSNLFIYLPEGFDPTQRYNVMLTLGTSSGAGSKQSNSLRHFCDLGIANGWIVMTSDSVKGRPPNYGIQWRITMIDAALDVLNEEWPASKQWNLVAGGSSGGAKAAQGVIGAMGSKKYGERRITGLFLTGCNQEIFSTGERSESPSRKATGNVAVFYSQGLKDKIAPPAVSENLLKSLKKQGMRKQKYVEHNGGHSVYKPHVEEAFKWLSEHCAELDAEL